MFRCPYKYRNQSSDQRNCCKEQSLTIQHEFKANQLNKKKTFVYNLRPSLLVSYNRTMKILTFDISGYICSKILAIEIKLLILS